MAKLFKKLKKGLSRGLKGVMKIGGSLLGGGKKRRRRGPPMPTEPSPMAEEAGYPNMRNVGYPPAYGQGQPGMSARYVQPIPQFYGPSPEMPAPPPYWQQQAPMPAPVSPAPAMNMSPTPQFLPPPPPPPISYGPAPAPLPSYGSGYEPYDPYAAPLAGEAALEYQEMMAGVTDEEEGDGG